MGPLKMYTVLTIACREFKTVINFENHDNAKRLYGKIYMYDNAWTFGITYNLVMETIKKCF